MFTRWKIGIAAVALFIALLAAAWWLFSSVMNPEWSMQRAAISEAYAKTVLAKAAKVDRFVGDETFTVIQGEDKIGQPLIVWVSDKNTIYTEMASGGITAAQAEDALKARQPEAELIRVMPGMQNGQPVWELFYKVRAEDKREHYFYDYYAFKDGGYIDTWRLTIQ